MRRLRILVTNPGRDIYGSERSLIEFISHTDAEVFLVAPGGGSLEFAIAHATNVHFCALQFPAGGGIRKLTSSIAFAAHFVPLLVRSHADVVLINLDGSTPLITLAARILRRPVVRVLRLEPHSKTTRLSRLVARLTSHFVAPSLAVKDLFLSIFENVDSTRVSVVSDPVNVPPREKPVSPRSSRPRVGNFTIGCVARIDPDKGLDMAICSLAILVNGGCEAELLIAGDVTARNDAQELLLSLKKLAVDLGVESRVQFLGYIPPNEMSDFYDQIDVLVSTSKTETFGLSIVEAWAAARPVVATSTLGTRELLMASEGGSLVESTDSQAVADALMHLARNASTRAELGKRGYKWVVDNCNPALYSQKMYDIARRSRENSG